MILEWLDAIFDSLFSSYPSGLQGITLLLLRLFVGAAFILHGYPKIKYLRTWANALKTPVWLCFLSAASMLGGGVFLILGLLTPLASFAILVSMAYAMVLEISQGLPFVARDPYLIPEGQYRGPMGIGEPPSWEKAGMYVVTCLVLIFFGGGAYSFDALIFSNV